MTHTPLAKGEPLPEMSTEQLLLVYRRIKFERDGSSIKVLESHLEEARKRDAERTQMQARIAELEAQLNEAKQRAFVGESWANDE